MDGAKNTVLLSTAYLAPVQYYTKLISYPQVQVEAFESFQKQTYRNRTIVLSANGPLSLSIPITAEGKVGSLISDIRISYDHPWQKVHWGGIVSAYRNSPFFDYFSDDLAPFYHRKDWQFLIDYNRAIQEEILSLLRIKCTIQTTETYLPEGSIPEGFDDFRYSIHPKQQRNTFDPSFKPADYIQVFSEKFGFVPNLSILDLLFCEGNQALQVLKDSVAEGL